MHSDHKCIVILNYFSSKPFSQLEGIGHFEDVIIDDTFLQKNIESRVSGLELVFSSLREGLDQSCGKISICQTSKGSILPQGLNDKYTQKQDIRLAGPFEPGVGDHLTDINYIREGTTQHN